MEGPECGRNDAEMEMVTVHCVNVPPGEGIVREVKHAVKETLFPDDPFRQFKNQPRSRKCVLGLQYVFPILQWAPKYSLNLLKYDVLSGITIATLAIPQGISYAKLANLPPVMGLCEYSCSICQLCSSPDICNAGEFKGSRSGYNRCCIASSWFGNW